MANSYRKIYLHLVIVVKNRQALLHKSFRERVFGYIHESINNRGNHCYRVGGYLDHVHILFDYKGKELLEDLVREIKKSSNEFIKDNNFTLSKFEWQIGYAIFSVGYRERDMIINYIHNQENHHSKKKGSFKEEYLCLLKDYEIDFKEEYVFEFLDDLREE